MEEKKENILENTSVELNEVEENVNLVPSKDPLTLDSEEIINKLIESKDSDEIKKLTQLFNVNQTKKEVVRINKLNTILDEINDLMLDRVKHDYIEDKNLVKYSNAINQSLLRSSEKVNKIEDAPLVQLFQENNTINIGDEFLSRESREKIINTVRQLLEDSKSEDNVIDLNEEDIVYYDNEEESE